MNKSHRFRSLGSGALLVMAIAAVSARADEGWLLTTSDFKTESVTLSAIDSKNVTIAVNNETREIPLSTIVQLNRSEVDETVKGLVLCVAGGERLVGTPRELDGQSLIWFTSGVGDIPVSMDQALGMLRDRTAQPDLAADRTEDTAKLATGDLVHGIVTGVAEDAFTITPTNGDAVKVPVEAISTLLFASPPGGRSPVPAAAFHVHIAGGSVVAFESINLQGATLTGKPIGGKTVTIPIAQVTGIENTDGPVSWLSARTPIQNVYTPFLTGNFPARMDRSVEGRPIRFDGITYARGIGVHSRSKLVFAIQPTDGTFRTRYAIDGDLSDADVDVRILVDGAVVHEKKDFRAGVLTPIITADLSHAKTLTLEVDYGTNYDIQDRLNWIEPAILRK